MLSNHLDSESPYSLILVAKKTEQQSQMTGSLCLWSCTDVTQQLQDSSSQDLNSPPGSSSQGIGEAIAGEFCHGKYHSKAVPVL